MSRLPLAGMLSFRDVSPPYPQSLTVSPRCPSPHTSRPSFRGRRASRRARAFATAAEAKNDLSKQKLIIFDTTLRDGEQSPG